MRKATKICRICGKEYEACKPAIGATAGRWQDVACCVEHGAEYFARIAESRGEAETKPETTPAVEEIKEEPTAEAIDSTDETDEAPVSKRKKKRV